MLAHLFIELPILGSLHFMYILTLLVSMSQVRYSRAYILAYFKFGNDYPIIDRYFQWIVEECMLVAACRGKQTTIKTDPSNKLDERYNDLNILGLPNGNISLHAYLPARMRIVDCVLVGQIVGDSRPRRATGR